MEVSRYVNLFYAIVFITAMVVFNKAIVMIWDAFERLPDLAIVGSAITLTNLIAVILAAAVTYWLYAKDEYRTYVSEVIVELKKVTWPSAEETKRSTVIVIVFTILVSLFLAGTDQVWRYLTDLILVQGS